MVSFLFKGGVLVIPIALCSVVALAVFLERWIFFARIRKNDDGLVEALSDLNRGQQAPGAVELSRHSRSPLGRLLTEVLSVRGCEESTRQAAIRDAYARESRNLASRLQLLATIGNISPLLGLLGTITGMIKAFMVIQQTGGKVDAAALAGGIWEAMLTTALGLAVALPVMMAHSYLVSRAEDQEAYLKHGMVRFLKESAGR
ncbi:MotA/TolQ/ExbB proton channel family protein [Desulfoluna spongiiphila]|uniref:Biopolymer transport protein ExbB n=1 Tax=Desulfoluna spongiiphila TaxID=419481 RepID=A0A1G5F5B6_9BACT|nr:MotA/TolQ/ExbB proton channel family protein [Desulfoluna spongiiphila]SCY34090.1 biopolymer transport protein ExbB [Desulfoluna spongiiphila]VVS94314.1 mota/tolq/exbb proton channel [Desulfoluna spongiiphila]